MAWLSKGLLEKEYHKEQIKWLTKRRLSSVRFLALVFPVCKTFASSISVASLILCITLNKKAILKY